MEFLLLEIKKSRREFNIFKFFGRKITSNFSFHDLGGAADIDETLFVNFHRFII